MNQYRDTMPVVRPMSYEPGNIEEQAQRLRDSEGQCCTGECQQGRECPMRDSEFGALEGMLSPPALVSAAVAVGAIAALVIVVTMGVSL